MSAVAARTLAGCVALLALALLSGCGDPLVTSYGTTDGGSVNGVAVLKARCVEAFQAKTRFRLSSRLDDCNLILHVQRDHDLPGPQACAWITTWLKEQGGRQFVLILRDGNVAPWLCRRWAAEALNESLSADAPAAGRLRGLAERLEARAAVESDAAIAGTCPLFERRIIPDWRPHLLGGVLPATLAQHSEPVSAHSTPLLQATGLDGDVHDWAIEIPYGDSRLVVVANATPFLDAALVDPDARLLLSSWLALLSGYRDLAEPESSAAAWVDSLAVREGDPKPPNILAMLFGTPPFNYVIIHAVALGLAFLAWKSAWLGRISAPRSDANERFSRHVEALALQLRDAGAVSSCAQALALHAGRPLERKPTDVRDAIEQVAIVCRPQTATYAKRKEPRT